MTTPNVNVVTNDKQKDADINQKTQLYGIFQGSSRLICAALAPGQRALALPLTFSLTFHPSFRSRQGPFGEAQRPMNAHLHRADPLYPPTEQAD